MQAQDVDTVAKVVEISSQSKLSFQDAIERGVARACQTLQNVRGAWVKEQELSIDQGKIVAYRVIMKVTFVLAD